MYFEIKVKICWFWSMNSITDNLNYWLLTCHLGWKCLDFTFILLAHLLFYASFYMPIYYLLILFFTSELSLLYLVTYQVPIINFAVDYTIFFSIFLDYTNTNNFFKINFILKYLFIYLINKHFWESIFLQEFKRTVTNLKKHIYHCKIFLLMKDMMSYMYLHVICRYIYTYVYIYRYMHIYMTICGCVIITYIL